jgi:hypothetical protein
LLLIAALLRPEASLLAAETGKIVQPSSLCRAEEQVIFTCVAAGSAKLVSLCGSKLLDHRRGYLQYRYGIPGVIELQFPQARANTQLVFRYAHYFRAQVDRTEISFDNQDNRYTLFDYYDSDVKPVIAVAGVRIGKHGTKGGEAELRCQSRPASKLGSLETVIRRDYDNPLNQ